MSKFNYIDELILSSNKNELKELYDRVTFDDSLNQFEARCIQLAIEYKADTMKVDLFNGEHKILKRYCKQYDYDEYKALLKLEELTASGIDLEDAVQDIIDEIVATY